MISQPEQSRGWILTDALRPTLLCDSVEQIAAQSYTFY